MSTKSILNRSISPSKVEVEIQDSKDLTDEQKSLYKAQSIVERCRRLATSPVKLLPKDIENLATLLRQLKLYLTVNEDLRDPFARSPSFTVLISVAKRFFSWMGILSDFISCVGLALSKRPVRCGDPEGSTQGSDSGADRYNELLELMCGYGFIDICTIFLKKQETCAESTRLCCLETILMLCDYVSLRSSKTTAPPGRDVVFDGKAMIKSAVHLLVKNGAIKLFPKLLLDNYGSFGGNGSSCIVQLMLFILRNCSSENATEMCRAIDKGFVSAAVVLLFRSQPTPGEAPSPALMHVIILVAGLAACNDEIALALARDTRKWNKISYMITNNFQFFEGNKVYEAWYRGSFDAVSRACEALPAEDGSSSRSAATRNTRSSKSSKGKMHSPIGNNNKSPILFQSKSSIVSFDEKVESENRSISPAGRSFLEKESRQGSSVQYALAMIAAENDPLRIDVDETATSAVLYRLAHGPYSGGRFQSANDLPGVCRAPKAKSSKASAEQLTPATEALKIMIKSSETEINARVESDTSPPRPLVYDFNAAMAVMDAMTDDGFIYDDLNPEPTFVDSPDEAFSDLSETDYAIPLDPKPDDYVDFEPELALDEVNTAEHLHIVDETVEQPQSFELFKDETDHQPTLQTEIESITGDESVAESITTSLSPEKQQESQSVVVADAPAVQQPNPLPPAEIFTDAPKIAPPAVTASAVVKNRSSCCNIM